MKTILSFFCTLCVYLVHGQPASNTHSHRDHALREGGSKMCKANMDATILLDQSGSITPDDFVKAKTFVSELALGLMEADRDTHIGLIAYGGQTCVELPDIAPFGGDSCRKRNSGGYISSYSTSSGFDCKRACQKSANCKAVNFIESTDTCEMYSKDATSADQFFLNEDCTYLEMLPDCTDTKYDEILSLGHHDSGDIEKVVSDIRQPYMANTPTGVAIEEALNMIEKEGREGVSKIIFLLTDGQPTDLQKAKEKAQLAKDKKNMVATIGVNINNDDLKKVLVDLASQPSDIYAHPNVPSYSDLLNDIGMLIDQQCFYINEISPTCGNNGTTVDIQGHNLYDTNDLSCIFVDTSTQARYKETATHIDDSNANCSTLDLPHGTYYVEITVDGVGITENKNEFTVSDDPSVCALLRNNAETGAPPPSAVVTSSTEEGLCSELWICILIPLLALLLLLCIPLAYFLAKKSKKDTKSEKKLGISAPEAPPLKPQPVIPPAPVPAAPAQSEDVELELIPKKEEPPPKLADGRYKWQVQSSSYIGFGKGKMDVEWTGEVPESAPHATKRVKVLDPKGRVTGDPVPQSEKEADDLDKLASKGGKDNEAMNGINENGMHGADYDYEVNGTKNRSWWQRMFCCCCAGKTAAPKAPQTGYNVASTASTPANAPALPTPVQPAALPLQPPAESTVESAPVNALPPGWEELTTDDGETYYEHRENQVTQWERPT